MKWGGDDELSFRFIVLLLHGLSCDFIVMWGDDELSLRFSSSLDMNCEVNFVCCYADSPISGSFNPVLLRRCFVVGPRHTWMYPLRFILQQDEY